METATQETVKGIVCGPVRIQIEGFRPIHHEVAFVEMTPEDGEYEPLVGYLVLEHSQAVVDVLGHRLVKIKHMDLKIVRHFTTNPKIENVGAQRAIPWDYQDMKRN